MTYRRPLSRVLGMSPESKGQPYRYTLFGTAVEAPVAALPGFCLKRGIVSEPVFRPRIFASRMLGRRRICGVSIMMISV